MLMINERSWEISAWRRISYRAWLTEKGLACLELKGRCLWHDDGSGKQCSMRESFLLDVKLEIGCDR